ncbi:MAG: FtsW/RodA/SpoVE family cell cycle protein [Clostridia bacterium]|nr:FtsW/RodA/SpoVE family cell cycle protein [Clostridia bacterium]
MDNSKLKSEALAHFGVFYLIRDIFSGKKKIRDLFSKGSMDITFFALVIALLTVGIIMMFSASYVNAMYDADAEFDAYFYVKKQALFAIFGLALMIAVSHIKTDVFRDSSSVILIIALFLLVYVLINPAVIPGKEQFKRWISVPLVGTFQPSEIAKLAIIMFLAFSMERYHKLVEKTAWMMVPYIAVIGLVCILVYKENHVSGTLLILGIGVATMYFGGIKIPWYFYAGIIALVLIAGIWFVLNADKFLEGYASERIRIWLKLLTGEELTGDEATGSGWQSLQSLYAIGSGGLFGLGFGNSKQKHMYIPEPQNDFVFAVVCEELGFARAILIILLFILLVGRGFVIGLRARSRFEAMLAMGISFQVGLQAALNIAVVTSTVPNTGISLPFFSYGGTSLVMLLIEMGMVLAVSRNGERKTK